MWGICQILTHVLQVCGDDLGYTTAKIISNIKMVNIFNS